MPNFRISSFAVGLAALFFVTSSLAEEISYNALGDTSAASAPSNSKLFANQDSTDNNYSINSPSTSVPSGFWMSGGWGLAYSRGMDVGVSWGAGMHLRRNNYLFSLEGTTIQSPFDDLFSDLFDVKESLSLQSAGVLVGKVQDWSSWCFTSFSGGLGYTRVHLVNEEVNNSVGSFSIPLQAELMFKPFDYVAIGPKLFGNVALRGGDYTRYFSNAGVLFQIAIGKFS